jgi:hypothetical protein
MRLQIWRKRKAGGEGTEDSLPNEFFGVDEDFFMRADKVSEPWSNAGNTTKESEISYRSTAFCGNDEKAPGWKQLEWLALTWWSEIGRGHQVFVVFADYGHVWRIK